MVAQIVRGTTPRLTATYTRAADATAYQAGDFVGNSTTAASVVPIIWDLGRYAPISGRLSGARCVITSTGTIVVASAALDLILFRPGTDIPFAAGSYPADNAPVNLTAAAMREIIAIIPFTAAAWRNQIDANAAAGNQMWQDAGVAGLNGRPYAPFSFDGLTATVIRGLLVAQSAWTPGNYAQQFDVALDVDLD